MAVARGTCPRLQLVKSYCQGVIPGLWPFIWSLVIIKARHLPSFCTCKPNFLLLPPIAQLLSGKRKRNLPKAPALCRPCKPKSSCGADPGHKWHVHCHHLYRSRSHQAPRLHRGSICPISFANSPLLIFAGWVVCTLVGLESCIWKTFTM